MNPAVALSEAHAVNASQVEAPAGHWPEHQSPTLPFSVAGKIRSS